MAPGAFETGTEITGFLLSSDEMREAVAEPRQVPLAVREYLAEIILRDLVLGEDYVSRDPARAALRLGPLFHLFLAARYTDEWADLRGIASAGMAIALVCACNALNALLDAYEESLAKEAARGSVTIELDAFAWLIRDTLVLWGRRAGNEKLPATRQVMPDNAPLVSDLVQTTFVPRIRPFLDDMAGSAEAIEFLSLLYPGRLWDRGIAGLHHEHVGNLRRYSEIAARSRELRQMLDVLGQSSGAEAPGKSAIAARSQSELYSVVNSNDLQYILPSELVKLQDRTMKYLFLARWAEGKLLTYQLSGGSRPRAGQEHRKGPVMAMVDTSGSMSGSPGMLAKAVVLAATRRALGAGRDMRVVLFSSTGQTETIDLSGHRKEAAEFLDFLGYTFGGGTDFDTALRSGLDGLREERYGSADLLFITDGLSKITDERLLVEWDRFKARNGARIYTIIVGNDSAGGLELVSDHVYVLGTGPGMTGDLKLTSL